MQIFVDMDGVLADFDTHYEAVFGYRASKLADNVDWKAVRAVDGFYLAMPPMLDMQDLWACVAPFKPVILTGIPSSVSEAAENKREWARKNIGPDVDVICCRSSEKFLYARRDDVLIDDWEKYRHLWIGAGGQWITHVSAAESIAALDAIL